MRRVKIYVTDVREGDKISAKRDEDYPAQRVFREPKFYGIDGVEIATTFGGVETVRRYPAARMVWMEID